MRDFTVDHLPRLSEEARYDCAQLLADIVCTTRYAETGESALRALHAIIVGAEDKRRIWASVYPKILMWKSDNVEKSVYRRRELFKISALARAFAGRSTAVSYRC